VLGRHLIVFLPGIGGSALSRPQDRDAVVWDGGPVDALHSIARPARLTLQDWPQLEPVGLIGSTRFLGFTVVPGYERVLRRLQGFGTVDEQGDPRHPRPGADVVAVPYDFRRGMRHAAQRLDDVVRAHLDTASEAERAGRVIVVAHSMGGLVARYWMGAMGRGVWCRALITLGTPHRGAPKALDWLVNGVHAAGVPIPAATELLRNWPSVTELLPRYPAVHDLTTGKLRYPHQLPIARAAQARDAYLTHCEIDASWRAMAGHRPQVVPLLGWGHATPDAATWTTPVTTCTLAAAGASWTPRGVLTVTKDVPHWLDGTGWEHDRGDGTVPAVAAIPVEMSHHHPDDFRRLTDRHSPLANTGRVDQVLRRFDERRPIEWIRGGDSNGVRSAGLGLDLDDLHPADRPVPVTVVPRCAPSDLGGRPLWITTRQQSGRHPQKEQKMVLEPGRGFTAELCGLAPGLHEVTVQAQEVPGIGDLWACDTIAVVDGE
jgi:hypothetical protein